MTEKWRLTDASGRDLTAGETRMVEFGIEFGRTITQSLLSAGFRIPERELGFGAVILDHRRKPLTADRVKDYLRTRANFVDVTALIPISEADYITGSEIATELSEQDGFEVYKVVPSKIDKLKMVVRRHDWRGRPYGLIGLVSPRFTRELNSLNLGNNPSNLK